MTLMKSRLCAGNAGGLIFVDFGMMSEIGAASRDSLLQLFYAVYRRDADAVLAALVDLNIIVPTADPVSLRRAIAFGLDNLMRKASPVPMLLAWHCTVCMPVLRISCLWILLPQVPPLSILPPYDSITAASFRSVMASTLLQDICALSSFLFPSGLAGS
jgi:hypothetical protein